MTTTTETRVEYVTRACRWCAAEFRRLVKADRYAPRWDCVRDAMLATETKFPELQTFGVESIPAGEGDNSPAITYLNSGDSYGLTILRVNRRFLVGTWGDIVERGNYP